MDFRMNGTVERAIERAKEEMKPKWFLFENVASMNEESKKAISECLGCKPIFINSSDFSAQSRPRLYWTNIPVDMNYIASSDVLEDIMENNVPEKYYYNCDFDFYGLDKTVCANLHINGHDIAIFRFREDIEVVKLN